MENWEGVRGRDIEKMHCEQNEAFSVRLVNGMNWEVKETRQGHRQTEWRGMEGGEEQPFAFCFQ